MLQQVSDLGQKSLKLTKNEFRMNLWKHMETGSFSDMETFIFIIFGNIIGYLCIDLRKHLIINVVV